MAQLDADAAQHEQPEDHHQRKIEAAEAGSVEQGEREVEGASGSEEPDFIAVPNGTDGAHDLASLEGGLGRAQIDDAGAEIESVEHNIGGNHDCDDHEPKSLHKASCVVRGLKP